MYVCWRRGGGEGRVSHPEFPESSNTQTHCVGARVACLPGASECMREQGIRQGHSHRVPVLSAHPCRMLRQVGRRTGCSICLLGFPHLGHQVVTGGMLTLTACCPPSSPGSEGLDEAVSGEGTGKGVAAVAPLATCCSVLCSRYHTCFISPHLAQ